MINNLTIILTSMAVMLIILHYFLMTKPAFICLLFTIGLWFKYMLQEK